MGICHAFLDASLEPTQAGHSVGNNVDFQAIEPCKPGQPSHPGDPSHASLHIFHISIFCTFCTTLHILHNLPHFAQIWHILAVLYY